MHFESEIKIGFHVCLISLTLTCVYEQITFSFSLLFFKL